MEKHYFEVDVCIDKMKEDGTFGKVTEKYLLDAMSFTEAESRITKELEPFIQGGFEVKANRKVNLSGVVTSDKDKDDKFFMVKWVLITLDEKTGKERLVTSRVVIQSEDFHHALKSFDEWMNGCVSDFKVVSMAETKIIDYLRFEDDFNQ